MDKLSRAWVASVPIVAVKTSDIYAAVSQIKATIKAATPNKSAAYEPKFFTWNAATGLVTPTGQKSEVLNPTEVLSHALEAPELTVYIMLNLHQHLHHPDVAQALLNCREPFKLKRRMVVLVGSSYSMPEGLWNDVVEVHDPLPTREHIKWMIGEMLEVVEVDEAQVDAAADACAGLSTFAAEQVVAMNATRVAATKVKIDTQGIWRDKIAKVNEVKGLKISEGEPYSAIAGIDELKLFMTSIMKGRNAPAAVVHVDEIEKAMSSTHNDSSGVAQDQLSQILQWMQRTKAGGIILAGAPGTVKSKFALATGTEFGVPTIQFDLGGMKGSLVGESEGMIRAALDVVEAVSSGRTLWIATCNSLESVPPELRRRFRFGTWYIDLPTREERERIWALFVNKYELDILEASALFDREWTGAEIESCCDIAWRCNSTLERAAKYIVPVSVAGAAQVESLRRLANGAFLNASAEGVYVRPETAQAAAVPEGTRRRKLS